MHLPEKEKEEPLGVEKDKRQFQVVIIGGGPAGIITSLTLSSRGIPHCIVEAKSEPSYKPGEAIPPNAKPLFKQLGIAHLLESKKHQYYHGNTYCWGNTGLEQKHFINDVHGHGYLLDRTYFELQLRELVKKSTATFFSGYRLHHILEENEKVNVAIANDNEVIQIEALYVVDATGKKASVCRHFGIYKKEWDQQFAITYQAIITSKIELQILIETTANGWWYMAPVHDKEITLMFFTLKELLPTKKDLKTFLTKELASTIQLSKLLKKADFKFDEAKMIPAGTSNLSIPYGKHWLAVGDAAYSFDPISSYGITSALASGYYGGHALADTCFGKENSLDIYRYISEKAFLMYERELKLHYGLEKRWKDDVYWKKRMRNYEYPEMQT